MKSEILDFGPFNQGGPTGFYVIESLPSLRIWKDKLSARRFSGIPAKTNYSDDEFIQLISTFQAWKKIRMIGSAAMAAVYVAAGKAERYQENGIFLWDIAAGAAIVSAAGGIASITNLQSDFRVDAQFSNNHIEE